MSGKNSTPKYYWDSCIYCALFNSETCHGEGTLEAIEQLLEENKENRNIIITSTLTLTEVFKCSPAKKQQELLLELFQLPNHIVYDLDAKIAQRAGELRGTIKVNEKVISTPDAIHIATAVTHRVDELHSFDKGKKGSSCSILGLSGHEGLQKLRICKPNVQNEGTPLLL